MLTALKLCGRTEASTAAIFKIISTSYRRSNLDLFGNPVDIGIVNRVCGAELFLGRALMRSDWPTEISDRSGPQSVLKLVVPNNVSGGASFEDWLKEELKLLSSLMIHKTTDNELSYAWAAHIKECPDWLTSGSPGMVQVFTAEGERVRASNKRIVVESMSSATLNTLRNLTPMLLATGSEKWENGKSRSKYGCDFISYFIISHALRHIEGKLDETENCDYGLTTWDQLRCILDKADYSKEKRDNFMMVFKNFNRQHSLATQAMIWQCISESVASRGSFPNIQESLKWVEEANKKQWFYIPAAGEKVREYLTIQNEPLVIKMPKPNGMHEVNQGLFSGVKSTNFSNTILNIAYGKLSFKLVIENLPVPPGLPYSKT